MSKSKLQSLSEEDLDFMLKIITKEFQSKSRKSSYAPILADKNISACSRIMDALRSQQQLNRTMSQKW